MKRLKLSKETPRANLKAMDYDAENVVSTHEDIQSAIGSLASFDFKLGDVVSVRNVAGETGYRVLQALDDGTGVAGNGGFWCTAKSSGNAMCSYADVSSLKRDVTLVEGNVVKMLGQDSAGDGKSHLRKIVSVSEALDKEVLDNGLFAEVVPNSYGVGFGAINALSPVHLAGNIKNFIYENNHMSISEMSSVRNKYIMNIHGDSVTRDNGVYTISNSGTGYYFYRLNTIDELSPGTNISVSLDVVMDSAGFKKQLRFMNGVTQIGGYVDLVNSNLSGGSNVYIKEGVTIPQDCTHLEIRLDYRGGNLTTSVSFSKLKLINHSTLVQYSDYIVPEKVFVSPLGDDMNNGLSVEYPMKTFKTALSTGASTISAKRGVYVESAIECVGGSIKIIPTDRFPKFSIGDISTPMIEILGGMSLFNMIIEENLMVWDCPMNSLIKEVFIDKTKSPVYAGTRPSYNVTVWVTGLDKDIRLEPVLDIELCKTKENTFTYIDGKIKMNFKNHNESLRYFISNDGYGIKMDNMDNVELVDVSVKYHKSGGIHVINTKNAYIFNCTASYSLIGNGFVLDNTNANVYACTAGYNNNDGFNIHGFGKTNFFDCVGFNNFDDGISHHDLCNGFISGGEYFGNGKAGIIPAYGACVNIYNVKSYNNLQYGIAYISDNGNPKKKCNVINSRVYGNGDGFYVGYNYDIEATNLDAYENTRGVVITSNAAFDMRQSYISENTTGVTLSSSVEAQLKCNKIINNVNSGIAIGSGNVKLSMNIIVSNGSGVSLNSGSVSFTKNNVHGNTNDYNGCEGVDVSSNISTPQY